MIGKVLAVSLAISSANTPVSDGNVQTQDKLWIEIEEKVRNEFNLTDNEVLRTLNDELGSETYNIVLEEYSTKQVIDLYWNQKEDEIQNVIQSRYNKRKTDVEEAKIWNAEFDDNEYSDSTPISENIEIIPQTNARYFDPSRQQRATKKSPEELKYEELTQWRDSGEYKTHGYKYNTEQNDFFGKTGIDVVVQRRPASVSSWKKTLYKRNYTTTANCYSGYETKIKNEYEDFGWSYNYRSKRYSFSQSGYYYKLNSYWNWGTKYRHRKFKIGKECTKESDTYFSRVYLNQGEHYDSNAAVAKNHTYTTREVKQMPVVESWEYRDHRRQRVIKTRTDVVKVFIDGLGGVAVKKGDYSGINAPNILNIGGNGIILDASDKKNIESEIVLNILTFLTLTHLD